MSGHSSSQNPVTANTPPVVAPPADATIDQLIMWLDRQREQDPLRPLAELIAHRSMATELLVELAAVDLIGQRRRGHDTLAEHYVQQFPRLAEDQSHLLDLIDAEICARREMNEPCDAEFLISRFPALQDPIRQLVHLEVPQGQSSEQSDPFLIQRDLTVAGVHRQRCVSEEAKSDDDSINTPIPIKPPAWMVATRCIATSQGETGRTWLIKGRDAERNDAVAMKIVPLPAALSRKQRTQILDLCETTSSVTHPSWVAPRIAALNNDHLAVVRPWIFGRSFASSRPEEETDQRLAALVRVAFSLAAAHRIGATHGSVKPENVITDHQSNVNLIDAVSSTAGWVHYLSIWGNDLSQTLDARITRDTQGLVELIAKACIASSKQSKFDWIVRVTKSVEFSQRDACAIIGENLQTLIDTPPTERTWWRK